MSRGRGDHRQKHVPGRGGPLQPPMMPRSSAADTPPTLAPSFKRDPATDCSAGTHKLSNPRTLPCFHSFCLSCLERSVGESTASSSDRLKLIPSRAMCEYCRVSYDIPQAGLHALSVDPFVLSLAQQRDKMSSIQNPNDVACGFCDEELAVAHCASCDLFFGEKCLKSHSKVKSTAGHIAVDVDEFFKKVSTGAADIRLPHCQTHKVLEMDTYCKTCQLAMCSSCIVPTHISHNVGQLASVSMNFTQELSEASKTIIKREDDLKLAIALSKKLIESLNANIEPCKRQIQTSFAELRAKIDSREKELLRRADEILKEKEIDLRKQKGDLEAIQEGMRTTIGFTQSLIERGNRVEIAASKKMLLSRLSSQGSQVIKLLPCRDEVLQFTEANLLDVAEAISVFGNMSGNLTSAKQSIMKKTEPRNTARSKEVVAYLITAMNEEGKAITRGGDAFAVKVDGPCDVKPHVTDKDNGTYSATFQTSERGKYRVTATIHGQHIKGSPMELKVLSTSPGQSYLKSQMFLFQTLVLVAIDEEGEGMPAGGDDVRATCLVDGRQVAPKINDNGNGTYTIPLPGNVKGICEVTVAVDNFHIKGSPFKGPILPDDFFGDMTAIEVLYDAKVHGYSNATFHQLCNDAEGTITLVTLKNGNVFGGYNPSTWAPDLKLRQKKITGAFLFSFVTGAEKFSCTYPQGAIQCSNAHGPAFGNRDLFINFDSLSSSYSQQGYYDLQYRPLGGSSGNWDFANVQVFQVL